MIQPKEPALEKHPITVPDPAGGRDHEVAVWDASADQFAARLRKCAKERRKWAKRERISCYRVYDADLPDFAVAVDLYLGAGQSEGRRFAVVAEYAAPKKVDPDAARRRFEDACAIVTVVLDVPPENVFAKRRVRDKGGGQYTQEQHASRVAFTAEPDYARQREYLVELDFGGYLDTGIFLDHRVTRQQVGKMSQGARFLNLFAYTGTATLHAAGGGAETTTTVDMSQTYLDRARRNMERNGFTGPRHRFVRADVTDWIVREAESGREYDLVFCDPPTFSNSKAMGRRTWDVQRDHVLLLDYIERMLAPGGLIVFSNNLRSFRLDEAGLYDIGLDVREVTADTIPHDFERNPRIHRCFLLERG